MSESLEHDILLAIEPDVQALMDAHKRQRKDWYFHDLVPWEQGRNFRDEPWDRSQCTLHPDVRVALLVNLLTEDNLPYYHTELHRRLPTGGVYEKWNKLWTSEEAQHAMAIRSYLLTTRNVDPRELEDDRRATMATGWRHEAEAPAELFAYTATQELATRVSHRNAGRLADDETANAIMAHVARDENHHYVFYRSVVSLMLKAAPNACLQGIHAQFSDFEMPGVSIPRFARRALQMAKTGIYNLRIHHDSVLMPLIRAWDIESLTDLDAEAQELQDKIMAMPGAVLAQAEAFEARQKQRSRR